MPRGNFSHSYGGVFCLIRKWLISLFYKVLGFVTRVVSLYRDSLNPSLHLILSRFVFYPGKVSMNITHSQSIPSSVSPYFHLRKRRRRVLASEKKKEEGERNKNVVWQKSDGADVITFRKIRLPPSLLTSRSSRIHHWLPRAARENLSGRRTLPPRRRIRQTLLYLEWLQSKMHMHDIYMALYEFRAKNAPWVSAQH